MTTLIYEAATDGGPAVLIATEQSPPDVQVVPKIVTNASLRIALAQAGLLDAVEAMVQAMPSHAPERILWEYATEFRRDNPMWDASAVALELGAVDVDQVFVAADALSQSLSAS